MCTYDDDERSVIERKKWNKYLLLLRFVLDFDDVESPDSDPFEYVRLRRIDLCEDPNVSDDESSIFCGPM